MRIPFRQGIVQHQASGFLFLHGSLADLVVVDTPFVVNLAHFTKNYLHVERLGVVNAWTITPSVDQWLFIDINTLTGARTFGKTLITPVIQATAPPPSVGKHWFDTTNKAMKVWGGSSWVVKVRIFVCKLQSGVVPVSLSIDAPLFTGTQIGDTSVVLAGNILFDEQTGLVLRTSDGKFITTEDALSTTTLQTSDLKFAGLILEAEAQQVLAAFTIVKFSDFGKIEYADEFTSQQQGQFGIIQLGTVVGDIAQVVVEGAVTNPLWDWTSAGVNAPLYSDATGQLVSVAPIPNAIPVATIVDKKSIVLGSPRLQLSTTTINNPAVGVATDVTQGTVRLNIPATNPLLPIAVGDNDPRLADIRRIEVTKNSGAVIGTRSQLNFIEGSNVTLTIADDIINDQVDITVASTGGGGGGAEPDNQIVYGAGGGTTIDSDPDFTYDPATGQFWVNTLNGTTGSVSVATPGTIGIIGAGASGTGTGGEVTIAGGPGGTVSGNGGILYLRSGRVPSLTSGSGGTIQIVAADGWSSGFAGGNVFITCGDGQAGANGGGAQIFGGNGQSNPSQGGIIQLVGGGGRGSGFSGGNITIRGGPGTSNDANGGNVIIQGGLKNGTGTNGSIRFLTDFFIERLEIRGDGGWEVGGSQGTSGFVLTSNGAGTPPTWQAGGGLTQTSGTFLPELNGTTHTFQPASRTGVWSKTGNMVHFSLAFQVALIGDAIPNEIINLPFGGPAAIDELQGAFVVAALNTATAVVSLDAVITGGTIYIVGRTSASVNYDNTSNILGDNTLITCNGFYRVA